jgi:hypothetical protein
MGAERKQSVLFVYFTYTKETLKVVEAMRARSNWTSSRGGHEDLGGAVAGGLAG